MNITTNDNSLAWTLSDNTAGSGKQKRGAKVKVAQQSQDVVTSSITKYLGDSAKFEHSNIISPGGTAKIGTEEDGSVREGTC